MVLCHSMNAGSVLGYHELVGTFKPYLMQRNLSEVFEQTVGMQKVWACMLMPSQALARVLAPEPPGGISTT